MALLSVLLCLIFSPPPPPPLPVVGRILVRKMGNTPTTVVVRGRGIQICFNLPFGHDACVHTQFTLYIVRLLLLLGEILEVFKINGCISCK